MQTKSSAKNHIYGRKNIKSMEISVSYPFYTCIVSLLCWIKKPKPKPKTQKVNLFFLQTPGHPHSHPKDHRADVSLLGSLLKISPFGPLKPWTLMKRLMIKNKKNTINILLALCRWGGVLTLNWISSRNDGLRPYKRTNVGLIRTNNHWRRAY